MAAKSSAVKLFEYLKLSRLRKLPENCGLDITPGVDEVPEWQVWVDKETTPDQLTIERYLDRVVSPTSSILHIGVGNSGLALRFASRVRRIVGTTIHSEEADCGHRLNLPNYQVAVVNKYSEEMDKIAGPFDFIVDNNPSSFACCLLHFSQMMAYYGANLGDGGQILTARIGLGWAVTGNSVRWGMSSYDWCVVGDGLDLRVLECDPSVYALERYPKGQKHARSLERRWHRWRAGASFGLRWLHWDRLRNRLARGV